MSIKCSTCGRVNPDDNEVCSACSSPLHPAPQAESQIAGQTEANDIGQGEESAALPAEELPEWLRALYSEEIASGSKEALAAFGPSEPVKGEGIANFQETPDLPAWLASS